MSKMSLSATVKQRALEVGFDLAGVAPLAARKDLEFARAWVERGFGGEMRYLQNPKRDDPRHLLPSAKSMVCVGLVYNAPLPYSTEESQKSRVEDQKTEVRSQESGARSKLPERAGRVSRFDFPVSDRSGARAWISRYAWGEDYHAILRDKLQELRAAIEALVPGVETRVYVDTGPIVERAFARFSGIGWMGKNTCLINEQKGSWFFIGVILTSLELDPDLPAPDRCGSCSRCLEACPTGALVEPYVMDATRCISYFTIELKGSIPAQFREGMGANVFGQRTTVPRTHVLADIAAEHVGAHPLTELGWNRPFELDSEIGDAPRRVHDIGLHQSSRRAGFKTPRAGTAAVGGRQVGIEFETGQDHADEEPRTLLLVNQASVLAHPANAGEPSKSAFHDGPGVDVHPRLHSRHQGFNGSAQLL